MDSETLREACVMAGIEIVRWGDGWAIAIRTDRFLNPENPVEREWIESRCADLLVGKVPRISSYDIDMLPLNGEGDWVWCCNIWWNGGHERAFGEASPGGGRAEAIITAAMAVLKGVGNA